MSVDYPLSAHGAASDLVQVLGDLGSVTLQDLTPWARFGLKGPGADTWFGQHTDLPAVNRTVHLGGMRLLRLGSRDLMVLADGAEGTAVNALRSMWESAPGAYSSWREETWAWLRLTGPGAVAVAARLTAFDLRDSAFAPDAIAQTRFAHQDCVVLRTEAGFDLLFDIASTAQVVTDIVHAAKRNEVFQ